MTPKFKYLSSPLTIWRKFRSDNKFRSKICILITLFILLMIPIAYADGDEVDEEYKDLKSSEQWAKDIEKGCADVVIKTLLPFDEAGNLTNNPYYGILFGDTFLTGATGSNGLQKSQIVTAIQIVLRVIAFLLSFVYFIEGMLNKIEKGRDFKQSLFRSTLLFIITLLVINNIFTLIDYIVKFALWAIQLLVRKVYLVQLDDKSKAYDIFNIMGWKHKPGFKNNISYSLKLFIPYLATSGAKIFVKVQCFSTLIELAVIIATAPLSCADIMSDGFHSAGIKNIQCLFEIIFRIGVIYIISLMVGQIQTAAFGNGGWEAILAMASLNLSLITIIGQAPAWSKKIIGVE